MAVIVALLLVGLCVAQKWAHHEAWKTYNLMQKVDRHEILPYYVIVLEVGQVAQVHCDSSELVPKLAAAHNTPDRDGGVIPQEQMIEDYTPPVPLDQPCHLHIHQGTRYHIPVKTCSHNVNYTVHNVWFDCHFEEESRTNIRLVTTPKRLPYNYITPPLTNHMDWWCLRDRNVTYAEAGHLLWMHWILNHENQRLLVVERFPAWELESGDLFECNGTVWQWGKDYSCLHILPSGWPALVHCHGIEQVFMIIVIILFFMFVYANGIAALNAYNYTKLSARLYVKRKFSKNQKKDFPLVPKDRLRPYSNMPDITVLQKKRGRNPSTDDDEMDPSD